MYVTLWRYAGAGSRIGEIAPKLEQGLVPQLRDQPGFRGIYLVRHAQDQTRMASVTLFDSRENAQRSHEEVVALVRDRMGELAPNPPRVVAGQTVILAI
jgi:hypothetical protein